MKNQLGAESVKRALAEFPDTPSKTVARVIYNRNPALFDSLESCYQSVRYYRGNHGDKSKMRALKFHKNLMRENQNSGFTWKIPPSKSDGWEPFILDSPRTLVMSDIHIPFHDKRAIFAFVKWGKKFKPHTILLNGDVCDFFSLSRFEKNITLSSAKEEVDSTRAFLGWLRDQFPKSRIIFKEGNHDEWLQRYIFRKAPELYGIQEIDLQNLLTGKRENEPEISGVEWVGDQRKIIANELTILHGHELGKGGFAPPVNPARGAFIRTNDTVLIGHLHRTSQHSERTVNNKLITCWSQGCFCDLSPLYSRVTKWDHSGVALELHGKDFSLEQVRIYDGKILTK